MKVALMVLGMHRSGTSALSRVLNLVGAALPERLLDPAECNEAGFWEPAQIVQAHDELLRAIGSRWDDFAELPARWHRSPTAESYVARLEGLVRSNYGDAPLIVLKDPRICRLLPLWLRVLERLGARPCCVLPIRNPLQVAASLKKRDGFSTPRSTLLWLRHVLDAERDSRGLARSLLRFESLMEDPPRVLARISRDLGLTWPRGSHRADLEIEEFLSERLVHHRRGEEELHAHSRVSEWVKRAFDALSEGLAGEEEAMRHRLDAIREEFAGADRAFGPILADAELRAERLESRASDAEALAGRVGPLERRVAELEAAASVREADAAALRARVAEQEAAAAAHELAEAGLRARVAELEAAGAGLRGRVAELEACLRDAERGASEERARAGHEIARLSGRVAALEPFAREAEALREEVGALRRDRDMLAGQIDEIEGTYGWKLLRVLRRADRALAPPGSRRNRATRLGLRALAILRREGPSGLVRRAALRANRPHIPAAHIHAGAPEWQVPGPKTANGRGDGVAAGRPR